MGRPEVGKENVNIDRIEPQGSYAVRLVFDDGHDTGIYSWETLYDLGVNQARYWNEYLQRLEAAGYRRGAADAGATAASRRARILYFAYLAQYLRKEAEEVTLPAEVGDVTALLAWLRRRERERGYLLADDRVRVTVNRQFTEPFTRLDDGDEIAYLRLRDRDPAHVAALMRDDAMTIPANVADGQTVRGAITGPVFTVRDGQLHMRYTARRRNIVWRDDPQTRAAVAALEDVLGGDEPLAFEATLQAGWGLLSNNVLHTRSGFEEGSGRLLYRARYYDRIAP